MTIQHSIATSTGFFAELMKWLLWLLPFNGLSHYAYPLWHYWLYAAYSLVIAGVVYAFGYRWARRRASEVGVS